MQNPETHTASRFHYDELVLELNQRADATTFQAGNVFYEILFGQVNLDNMSISYAYFGLSVVTLVCATVSIACASLISYWINHLPTHHKKAHFAYTFRKYEKLLTVAFVLSIYAWLFAMFCSSGVKYDQVWYISASWSGVGFLVMTWSVCYIRQHQAQYRPASQCRTTPI